MITIFIGKMAWWAAAVYFGANGLTGFEEGYRG